MQRNVKTVTTSVGFRRRRNRATVSRRTVVSGVVQANTRSTARRRRNRKRRQRKSRVMRSGQLLGKSSRSEVDAGFVMAALDPFCDEEYPMLGVPDGYPGRSITMKHRTNTVITTIDGTIVFCILPTLPASLWVYSGQFAWGDIGGGNNFSVQTLSTGNVDWFGVPHNAWSGYTAGALRNLKASIATNTPLQDTLINDSGLSGPAFGGLRARFIGNAFEARPTGTVLSTTGQAAVGRAEINFATGGDFFINSGDQNNVIAARSLEGVPTSFQGVAALEGSRLMTILDGAYVVAGGNGARDRWEFEDFVRQTQCTYPSAAGPNVNNPADYVWLTNAPNVRPPGIAVARPTYENFFIGSTTGPDTTTPGYVGSVFTGSNLGACVYWAQGLPSGYSLEVEVVSVVEYQLRPDVPLYETTCRGLPMDEDLLDEVEAASQKLPVVVGYRENGDGSFTRAVLGAFQWGLSFVSNMSIPVVSSVAQLGLDLGRLLNVWQS